MLYIGADHQGRELAKDLGAFLSTQNIEFLKVGQELYSPEDDYPDFAKAAVLKLLNDFADGDGSSKAILLCGSGQGMLIAANRFKRIRAGLCWDIQETRLARSDDDINVLCLPARLFKEGADERLWQNMIKVFLETEFKSIPKYSRRREKLDRLP